MVFLEFIITNSRKKPKYKSMHQYWRQFKMLFSRYTGYRMNTNVVSEVTKVIFCPDLC